MDRIWCWGREFSAVIAFLALAVSAVSVGAESKARRPPPASQPVAEADGVIPAVSESTQAERALAKKPKDRAARLGAARAHLAEGAETKSHIEAAEQHARAALEEWPTDTEALLVAAQASLLKGDPTAATRYYRTATLADPSNATAFLGLGDALTRLRDEAGATAAFARYRALMGMPPLEAETARK